ncbi:MAG TPA: SDR family oxidoreductase [Gemmatimonadales bacterium]|nr:SDR family oxidoreductase [Gemmatimonadales bacterium]
MTAPGSVTVDPAGPRPLAGRLAVVTGASRGIGLAAAVALRDAGAGVVRIARSLGRPAGGAASGAAGEGVHDGFEDFACDLTDRARTAAVISQVLAERGAPDVVVNNAGVFDRIPFEQSDPAELERQLMMNLVAPFAVARGFLPPMRARGSGMLITIGSVADHVAYPENTIYSAAKFGLRGLHETLAAEYRGTGVRCTLISPGPTDTAIWDPIDPDHRPGFLPRRAMLRPDDVAQAIVWAATRPAHVRIDWLRIEPAV